MKNIQVSTNARAPRGLTKSQLAATQVANFLMAQLHFISDQGPHFDGLRAAILDANSAACALLPRNADGKTPGAADHRKASQEGVINVYGA